MTKTTPQEPKLHLLKGTDCFDARELSKLLDNLMGTVSTEADIVRIQAKLDVYAAEEAAKATLSAH
jgi:hypothetical protein